MQQLVNVVILAAGQGTRMHSALPKVLHPLGAKPMLQHVIETAQKLNPAKLIIVHGHGGDEVRATMESIFGNIFHWVYQAQQLGTGHALKCALPYLDSDGITLLLYGDVPLISVAALHKMLDKYQNNVIMLTDEVEDPNGYGRVVRNTEFAITGIVEEKDASQSERLIREINTGFYIFPNKYLSRWLLRLSNNNNSGEYYITDIIALSYNDNIEIDYVLALHHYEVWGVNNKLQLEQLERIYQLNQAKDLLDSGVTLADKHRIDIRGSLTVGSDCMIDINCVFNGRVTIGNKVKIGAGCIISNAQIGNEVTINPYTIIEDATIGIGSQLGPYTRLRPGTHLAENTHIGNFVEVKNSQVGKGSKVNHLTYIGDSEIGCSVNVGAGTVTCNYDGINKFKTVIGDNAFIGSGTMLVAPVVVNQGSVIGAGSVITHDTESNELTVARARQVTVHGWNKRKG